MGASVMTMPAAQAMTYEERMALDLSDYTVTDPDASFLDVEERMALLKETDNPMFLQQIANLSSAISCRQLLALPPLDGTIRIPGFYPTPDKWRFAVGPLYQFEDNVSELAGAYVATGDHYYAECLVKFLDKWGQHDALMDFFYTWQQPQAWFSTESMIFAAAMAYSAVRPAARELGMQEEISRVDDWLNRLAHHHAEIPGHRNSCCNNHFYRRALYGTMVGILTEDNDLFRFGVSAIYSALHDLTEEGALPLEVQRGRRASHYQNYALLYLIPNMELIARQGYDIYNLEVEGNTIQDAIDFALAIFEDPSVLGDMAPHEQYRGFMEDDQYFTWMEMYLTRYDDPRMEEYLRPLRPIYNRHLGGYTTLLFMDPKRQAQEVIREEREQRQEQIWQGTASASR